MLNIYQDIRRMRQRIQEGEDVLTYIRVLRWSGVFFATASVIDMLQAQFTNKPLLQMINSDIPKIACYTIDALIYAYSIGRMALANHYHDLYKIARDIDPNQ